MSAPLEHGTYKAYSRGCRCAGCREANRMYGVASRARRAADSTYADAAGHGKAATYNNHGCRCTPCRTAHAANVRSARRNRGGRS